MLTLPCTTNGPFWKPGFGVSPNTSADTTFVFIVFMFTSCNVLTVLKNTDKSFREEPVLLPPKKA